VRRARAGAAADGVAVRAFAPGRVNLIGEHTDYDDGLALPFAIRQGVTVGARATGRAQIEACAVDLGESDAFSLSRIAPAVGWRAFVRGAAAELQRSGFKLVGAQLQITGDVARGGGLSSSAALEVALCLALLALSGQRPPEPVALARICQTVEHRWVGAQTGLLDQLASLCGRDGHAMLIDFRSLSVEPVALRLGAHRLVIVDCGQRREHASSAYNERRAQCRRARELLGLTSLRDATLSQAATLPEPLDRRVRHVITENERVRATALALRRCDLPAVGALLDASHESLRDDFEVSSAAVEQAVARLRRAGALGARLIGGGFGGHVLGLLAAATPVPPAARTVAPGPGAHLLSAI
jgi:galactokinase